MTGVTHTAQRKWSLSSLDFRQEEAAGEDRGLHGGRACRVSCSLGWTDISVCLESWVRMRLEASFAVSSQWAPSTRQRSSGLTQQ